jgi:hypothetical protein
MHKEFYMGLKDSGGLGVSNSANNSKRNSAEKPSSRYVSFNFELQSEVFQKL